MSLGSEARIEAMIEEDLAYMETERRAMQGIWITKDGRQLHVSQMTDKHIENCLAILHRSESYFSDPFIIMFEKEQRRRVNHDKRRPHPLPF